MSVPPPTPPVEIVLRQTSLRPPAHYAGCQSSCLCTYHAPTYVKYNASQLSFLLYTYHAPTYDEYNASHLSHEHIMRPLMMNTMRHISLMYISRTHL